MSNATNDNMRTISDPILHWKFNSIILLRTHWIYTLHCLFVPFSAFYFQNINPFSHHNILITSWFKEKHNIQQKIHRQSILIHPNSLIIILMIKSAEVHCVRFLLLTSATINWSDVLLKLHACPNWWKFINIFGIKLIFEVVTLFLSNYLMLLAWWW